LAASSSFCLKVSCLLNLLLANARPEFIALIALSTNSLESSFSSGGSSFGACILAPAPPDLLAATTINAGLADGVEAAGVLAAGVLAAGAGIFVLEEDVGLEVVFIEVVVGVEVAAGVGFCR